MQKVENWSLNKDKDNIIWLGLNRSDSKVNSLNEKVLQELYSILQDLKHDETVKGLIIYSEKKTGFIVGADIAQFKLVTSASEATEFIKKGQEIFNFVEKLLFPTVAMIEGFCLGGGLELALACRYRIAEDSPKTRLGLPEVKLGIHPGWGGSVRLPELIGPTQAMDIILTGKMIYPKPAKKMGLVNEAVPKRLLEKVAKIYALNPPSGSHSQFNKLMNASFFRPILGKILNNKLKQKVNPKHYPAPFKVVQNWVKYGTEKPKAFNVEAESIGKLLVTPTSKNLVRVFFLQEQLKNLAKDPNFKVNHVHVVGAGVMGGDIAAWCALRGLKVTLQDQAPKLIGNAIKRCFELASKQQREKYLIQETMDRLHPDPNGLGIKNADVIIEAITENLEAKQDLFAILEKQSKPEAILATNTSTIPLEEISRALKDPQRLIGIHFFNPVAKMPLVEVVKGENTDPSIVLKTITFVRAIDRLPLPVKSVPGFLVNRILMPYMLEAMALLEEGIPAPVIDKAAVDFGMPMGPVELADTVGLDICLAALEKLSHSSNLKIPTKLKQYVERGELGRKSGKGFYHYKQGKPIKAKPAGSQTIAPDISKRLILRLLNESVACLREGVVESSDLLDAGCIFGFGFPPFRGGPITYARSEDEKKMIKLFEEFESNYGNRFAPDKGWITL